MKASLLFVLALLTACSSSSSSTGSSAFLSSFCDAFAPCCAKAGRPSDGAQCRAFYGAFTSSASFDQAKADKCLADIQAAKGNADYCEKGISPPSCDGVFGQKGGTKAPGETCSSDSECAASTEGKANCGSVYKGGMTIKKCQIVVVGKAGDSPCVETIDGSTTYSTSSSTLTDVPTKGYSCDKASGLTCDSTSGACKALAKEGEGCTFSDGCLSSLYCEGASTCAKRAAVGAACTAYDSCEKGASCEANVCKAKSPTGAACMSGTECAAGSCVNGVCGSDDFALALLCGGG